MNVNKLVVGSYLGMAEVSIYDLGEKMTHLMKSPISVVAQSVFPKISREKNINFLNKLMVLVASISIIGYIIIYITSDWIVCIFTGNHIDMAVNVVRILSISAIIVSFNSFLGGNRLVPFRYPKKYMQIMLQNCLFFCGGIMVLILSDIVTIYSLASMSILVELISLTQLISANKRYGILKSIRK